MQAEDPKYPVLSNTWVYTNTLWERSQSNEAVPSGGAM